MTDPYRTPQPQEPYQQPQAGDTYTGGTQQPTPAPQQWVGPDGQPHAAVPPPAQPNRKPVIVAAVATAAVLLLGVAGYAVWDGYIKEDSGVAACKAMRDGEKIVGDDTSAGDDKMTEAEYREVRELFEDSRHEDIREHGTGLIDILWQVSNLPEGQEMGALAFIGPMGTHVSGLQTACADQGVIVNLNQN
ncbi:hypothetical protein [Micromonospora costi]|uniref:Uncharacterized protein n=1 Tax=Micromonospora costi TaxID=1530042 RepID=A0A3A9ZXS4_9ACTN|nr:hypothetical protein [Micromonospora costi]RKN53112.1 hypothetical protein D7193_25365 [Micromonospora costi]